MWQTKYAAAIPKNLGVGMNFLPCSEGYFLSGRPQSVLPAIGHPDHVPYIITFAFAGHGRRKKSLLLRINMYRSAVLPVNSSCDTITYFPLAQHAETQKVVQNSGLGSINQLNLAPTNIFEPFFMPIAFFKMTFHFSENMFSFSKWVSK